MSGDPDAVVALSGILPFVVVVGIFPVTGWLSGEIVLRQRIYMIDEEGAYGRARIRSSAASTLVPAGTR